MDTSPKATARHRRAILMLLVATLFWALSFPIMKALGLEQQKLVPGADTWFLTWLGVLVRFGAAGALLALFLGRRLQNISKLELEQGFGLAVFGTGGILFQMDGLNYTAASTSAFLTQCYVVIIPLWVALVHQRRPGRTRLVSLIMIVIGLAVLAGVDFKTLALGRGETETLIGSVLFTGQILWLERPRYAANRPLHFSAVMFAFMALLCVPGVALTAPGLEPILRAFASPTAAGFLAVLVLVCTLGGYLFMNRWQRDVSATEAGMIYCAEPVLASLFALFLPAWLSAWASLDYPNEQLTWRLLLGGGLVTIANLLLHRR